MKSLVVALALVSLCIPSFASDDVTPSGNTSKNKDSGTGNPADDSAKPEYKTTEKSPQERLTQANKDFLGVNFSFGFGAVFFHGRVEEAQVVGQGDDARVVVTKDANKRPALVLEAHRLLDLKSRSRCFTTKKGHQCKDDAQRPERKEAGAQDTERVAFGLGPFLALQTSQDDSVIDTIGLGVMGGFHIGEGKAFNLGIGAMLDPSAKFLPPGYVDGQRPPKGFVAGDPVAGGGTSIPLVSKGKLGLLVLASFTF